MKLITYSTWSFLKPPKCSSVLVSDFILYELQVNNELYSILCYHLHMLVLLPTHKIMFLFPQTAPVYIYLTGFSSVITSQCILDLPIISTKSGTMAVFTLCFIHGTKHRVWHTINNCCIISELVVPNYLVI